MSGGVFYPQDFEEDDNGSSMRKIIFPDNRQRQKTIWESAWLWGIIAVICAMILGFLLIFVYSQFCSSTMKKPSASILSDEDEQEYDKNEGLTFFPSEEFLYVN